MRSVNERDIRGSFVNCSKGEATRLAVPRELSEQPWEDLDFLGWRDPAAPDRGYLAVERDGRLICVELRSSNQHHGFLRRGMCSVCLTTHPGNGVSLMAARKAGAAGRQGNSVGLYICSDLACSLYARGKKTPPTGVRIEESLTVEEKAARVRTHLFTFLDKLFA